MTKLKFNPEINIGHLFLAITFIIAAVSWKVDVDHKIDEEGVMRETKDVAITVEMRRISEILDDLEARVRANERHVVADEARGD